MTNKHILIVGGMHFMHRFVQELPGVKTSLINRCGKITASDGRRNHCILGLDGPAEQWVAMAETLHRLDPITHIAAFDDLSQDRAALIAAALDLPFHSPQTVHAIQNKRAMRRRLAECGLDQTATMEVGRVEDIWDFAAQHGLPAILKPVDGRGSTAISRIATPEDIAPAFERSRSESDRDQLLIETMLLGEEFSVEAFSEDGEHEILAITRKYKDPDTFVEVGHQMPALLPAATQAAIQAFVPRMLGALGVRNGPTHTELMVTAAGVAVIETHLRPGGDFIPEMVRDACGVDMLSLAARQAAGEQVMPAIRDLLGRRAEPQRYAAVWFRTDHVHGRLMEIRGADEAGAGEGVAQVVLVQEPGADLRPAQNSFERIALARAVGATPDEALQRARQAAARLDIVVTLREAATDA